MFHAGLLASYVLVVSKFFEILVGAIASNKTQT